MDGSSSSSNKAVIAIIIIVLLVLAAGATIVVTNKTPSESSATKMTSTEFNKNVTYGDGTYSATGSYQTPGGREQIGVKITVKNGTVTDASLTEMGQTGEAQEYQSRFASEYKSHIVGKNISEIKLDRVAGSSLTSAGFNDAINNIAKQAQL